MIRDFCEDAAEFLAGGEDRTIAVHCKAGRGRTGLMVCAYLVHSVRLCAPIESRRKPDIGQGICMCYLHMFAAGSCLRTLLLIAVLNSSLNQSRTTLHVLALPWDVQGICGTSAEAVALFNSKRTMDGQGLTVPSQLRCRPEPDSLDASTRQLAVCRMITVILTTRFP